MDLTKRINKDTEQFWKVGTSTKQEVNSWPAWKREIKLSSNNSNYSEQPHNKEPELKK